MNLVRGGVYLVRYGYTTEPAKITKIFESPHGGFRRIQFKLPIFSIGRWVIWWDGAFELTELEFVERLSVEVKESKAKGPKCAS